MGAKSTPELLLEAEDTAREAEQVVGKGQEILAHARDVGRKIVGRVREATQGGGPHPGLSHEPPETDAALGR
jgi:hypothetical protein